MGSQWGRNIRLSVFGESHGPAVGAVIEGLPAGFMPDMSEVERQMARRSPAGKPWATKRNEADAVEVSSGLFNGRLTGSPLCVSIRNSDAHSASYPDKMELPRPGHADYTAHVRYGGAEDFRGGGHFSGRLTAPIMYAGALAMQLLAIKGAAIGSHIRRIGQIADRDWDRAAISTHLLKSLGNSPFPTLDESAAGEMLAAIENAGNAGDSLGGEIETAVVGLPAGIGSPMMDGIESRLASLLFSIPAVKGVQFGDGFALASMKGSMANDPFILKDGRVMTSTNHNGGLLGGITTGMPLVFGVAVKPTPSIAQEQRTVNLTDMKEQSISVVGRHDPCIVPRALPVIEASAALVLLDAWLDTEPAWR
jgi:chorismate synthase